MGLGGQLDEHVQCVHLVAEPGTILLNSVMIEASLDLLSIAWMCRSDSFSRLDGFEGVYVPPFEWTGSFALIGHLCGLRMMSRESQRLNA